MKYYDLPKTDLKVSEIALGCMRIANKSVEEVEELVKTALDCGINFFDHADIYAVESQKSYLDRFLKNILNIVKR